MTGDHGNGARTLPAPLPEERQGALQAVRDDVVKKFTSCPLNDLDGLRQYRLMYEILDMIAGAIGQHVRTGILAEDGLKKLEQRKLFGRK